MVLLSHFESLPNELFCEIFEYLSGQDICRAFLGLNHRFKQIIEKHGKIYFEEREKHTINDQFWSNHVEILSIRHDHDIDLCRYINLRRIALEWPSEQQCDQIIGQNSLERIHLGHPCRDNDCQKLIKAIFTNQYPQLSSCRLENLSQIDALANLSSIQLPNMSSIVLLTKHPENVIRILESCPNLDRFYVKFIETTTLVRTFVQTENKFIHGKLHRLILDNLDDLSVEVIDQILRLTPRITRLNIKNPRSSSGKIHLQHMADTLCQRLFYLNHFHFEIWLEDLDPVYKPQKGIDQLKWLHPLFHKVALSDGGGKLIISSLLSSS